MNINIYINHICISLYTVNNQRKFSGKLPIYELLGTLTGIVVLAVVVVVVVVLVVLVVRSSSSSSPSSP